MDARETKPPPAPAGGLGVRGRAARDEQATPMRVLALHPSGKALARCAGTDGIPRTVEVALMGRIEPGAIVLVHAGVALVRLDAEWAP